MKEGDMLRKGSGGGMEERRSDDGVDDIMKSIE